VLSFGYYGYYLMVVKPRLQQACPIDHKEFKKLKPYQSQVKDGLDK